MKLLLTAAFDAFVSADKTGFPSFDMFHAKCELTSATVDKSCNGTKHNNDVILIIKMEIRIWYTISADFFTGLEDFVANNKDPASPPGTYKLLKKLEKVQLFLILNVLSWIISKGLLGDQSDKAQS